MVPVTGRYYTGVHVCNINLTTSWSTFEFLLDLMNIGVLNSNRVREFPTQSMSFPPRFQWESDDVNVAAKRYANLNKRSIGLVSDLGNS